MGSEPSWGDDTYGMNSNKKVSYTWWYNGNETNYAINQRGDVQTLRWGRYHRRGDTGVGP